LTLKILKILKMCVLVIGGGVAITRSTALGAERTDPITTALQMSIDGKASLVDVRIDAFWSRDGKAVSARIFGDGVGIWQRQLQFQLSKAQVVGILKTLQEAGFGSMPDRLGGEEEEAVGNEGPQLKGQLAVLAGSASKRVLQLVQGDQSKEFELLVNAVLDACAGPATRGIGAATMEEGLRMLAAGQLSPQILETTVQRPPDAKASDRPEEGWILRTAGSRATAEQTGAGKSPPPARELVLSPKEFRALATTLAEADPASLPQSLYAPRYTDLTVELFSYHRTIAGRRFLGMTPETHGDKQKAFDRLVDVFRALHERVEKQGKPVAVSLPSAPGDRSNKKAKEKERD